MVGVTHTEVGRPSFSQEVGFYPFNVPPCGRYLGILHNPWVVDCTPSYADFYSTTLFRGTRGTLPALVFLVRWAGNVPLLWVSPYR